MEDATDAGDPSPSAWHQHAQVADVAGMSFTPDAPRGPNPPPAEAPIPASPTTAERESPTPPPTWLSRIARIRQLAHKRYTALMKRVTASLSQRQLHNTHKLLAKNAKRLNRKVLKRDSEPTPSFTSIRRTDTNHVLTDPPEVLQEAARQMAQAKQAPAEAGRDRTPPWTTISKGMLPCDLRTATPSLTNTPLLDLLTRECYDRCLSQAQNRRSPGPNGIPNEILKHLPQEFHDMLYDAFRLFLLTGHAPPSWKHSETILLHKSGDPTLLKNWRPIGLADSAGKLYHAVLADAIYRFCTAAGLLSDTQFGFRRDSNCHQALDYVLSVFEDSHASKRNLYVAWIDLCDAFGSLPQARITEILTLLGLPQDAVQAVADMYSSATTSLRLPVGTTEKIAFNRGTLQGDTLSPLIFLLFMEPLLQWIAADDHGYHPGCAAHHSSAGRTDLPEPASTSAYADDLMLMARSLSGLSRMLSKISAYASWAGLKVNTTKSAVSGLEHTTPPGSSLAVRCRKAAVIDGVPLPFLEPNQSYKYLGIEISLSMSAKAHAAGLLTKVQQRLAAISDTPLFAGDGLHCMRSLVVSVIAYTLPIGILTPSHIATLQKELLRFCRDLYDLPTCIAREALLFPRAAGGLEFTNVDALATAAVADTCLSSLSNTGRLGRLARSLARMQLSRAGGSIEFVASRAHWPNSLWLSRLSRLHRAGLGISGLDCVDTALSESAAAVHLDTCRKALLPHVQDAAAAGTGHRGGCRTKARATADTTLSDTVQVLLDFGIFGLHQLVNTDATALMSAQEFTATYDAATPAHSAAFVAFSTLCAQHAAAISPILLAARQLRAGCMLPASPPPTPPPAQDSSSDSAWDAQLRAGNHRLYATREIRHRLPAMPRKHAHRAYRNKTLFPRDEPEAILDHRLDNAGQLEFLAVWADGKLTPVTANTQYLTKLRSDPRPILRNSAGRLVDDQGQPTRLIPCAWLPHWTPAAAIPATSECAAVRSYTALRRLSPPDLGHPLPPLGTNPAPHLKIVMEPSDPDTAIGPSTDASIHSDGTWARVYDAAGTLRGKISVGRLQALWRRFHEARPHTQPSEARSFELETCNLLRRLITGVRSSARTTVEVCNHWATPLPVLSAIRDILRGTIVECFGSPLNLHPETTRFCSEFAADSVFGATHDAFRQRWSGCCYLNPEYTVDCLHRAVCHAVACAKGSPAPFLAVGVMPKWSTQPFYRVMRRHRECCHVLAEIPKGLFNFERPEYAPAQNTERGNRNAHAHWPVVITLTYNTAGLATLLNADKLADLRHTLVMHALRTKYPRTRTLPQIGTSEYAAVEAQIMFTPPPLPNPDSSEAAPSPPPAMRPWMRKLLARLTPAPTQPATQDDAAVDTTMTPAFPYATAEEAPPGLAYDAGSIVYSDASLRTVTENERRFRKLGCGVFNPSDPAAPDHHFAATGTVLYGELLAICHALSLRTTEQPLHILTDSRVSLLLINHILYCPGFSHTHIQLLTEIRRRILARTAPTTLGKVTAHRGVVGNERADRNAEKGTHPDAPDTPIDLPSPQASGSAPCVTATGSEHPLDDEYLSLGDPANEIEDTERTPPPDPQAPHAGDPDTPTTPPPRFSQDIRSTVYRWLLRHRAQQPAATDMGRKLQRLFGPTLSAVCVPASMHFLDTAARVHPYARKTTLKIRYRCVYIQQRITPADPKCRLCGLFDGHAHLLGACKHPIVHGMICTKHNEGGQLVLKTFRQRSKFGGSCAVLANVGTTETVSSEPTCPDWLHLPNYRKCPDLLIIKGWTQEALDEGLFPSPTDDVQLIFIEHKTCSDYSFAECQQQIWDKYTPTQHTPPPIPPFAPTRNLFTELRSVGWDVLGLTPTGSVTSSGDRMLSIRCGHGAFILQETVKDVFETALQLSTAASLRLAKDLAKHQTLHAAKIFNTAHKLKMSTNNG